MESVESSKRWDRNENDLGCPRYILTNTFVFHYNLQWKEVPLGMIYLNKLLIWNEAFL